jgi:hypothetical protein
MSSTWAVFTMSNSPRRKAIKRRQRLRKEYGELFRRNFLWYREQTEPDPDIVWPSGVPATDYRAALEPLSPELRNRLLYGDLIHEDTLAP